MKKSEIYRAAILSVLANDTLLAEKKLEIIEQLMTDKTVAKAVEEFEEKKTEADEKW